MNIIYLNILLAMCFTSNLGIGQLNCAKFKVGKFVIKNEAFGDSYIIRRGNVQIERATDYNTGKKIKSKDRVIWIDECTYRLESIKNNMPNDEIMNETMIFEIISTESNLYVVRIRDEDMYTDVVVLKR